MEKQNKPIPHNKYVFTAAGSTFVIDKKYEFVKALGQGAYGVVCSCLDKKLNKKVAIKKISNAFED